jgi:hypothetical protein
MFVIFTAPSALFPSPLVQVFHIGAGPACRPAAVAGDLVPEFASELTDGPVFGTFYADFRPIAALPRITEPPLP